MKETGKFAIPPEGRPLIPAGAEPTFWKMAGRARALGIDMSGNVTRVANTRLSHALLEWAHEQRPEGQHNLKELIFQAYYSKDIYLDLDNLVILAGQAGYDMDAARAYLTSQKGIAQVKQKSDAAKNAGVNGVPHIFINEKSVFSGAQDPQTFVQALRMAVRG